MTFFQGVMPDEIPRWMSSFEEEDVAPWLCLETMDP